MLQFLLPARTTSPLAIAENSVAYTGTHDNDTSAGWWQRAPRRRARPRAPAPRRRPGSRTDEPSWLLIGLALASRARIAIVPAQDVLGLGNEARMNTPGRRGGNWRFRLEPGALDDALAARLREATAAAGRSPPG